MDLSQESIGFLKPWGKIGQKSVCSVGHFLTTPGAGVFFNMVGDPSGNMKAMTKMAT